MLPYIAALTLFWGGATIALFRKRTDFLLLCVVFVAFVLLAGTRYETGFDWPVYELALSEAPTLVDLFNGAVLQDTVRLMEPLFLLLLSTLKSFDADIQSWAYLVVQMAVIRQSLAVSFLMLAIMAFDRRRLARAALWLAMGTFIQYSLLLFLPIFFTAIWRRLLAWRYWIVGGLTLVLLSGISMFWMLQAIAGLIPNAFIAGKLAGYAALAPSPGFSVTAAAYFVLHTAIFLFLSRTYDPSSRIETVLIGSMMMMVIAQALIPEWPLLWNRLHYFVIVAQIVMLARRWHTLPQVRMRVEYLAVYGLSLAVFAKLILWPGMEPYLPYQSYLEQAWTGYAGDGRQRAEDYYLHFNEALRMERIESGSLVPEEGSTGQLFASPDLAR